MVSQNGHAIDAKKICGNAIKVLKRLNESGFEAYLVGGGVRDLLLDMDPKDFDISTNASPEEVKELFKNSRLIGRRFRLAHILFGRDIIEVATFRADHQQGEGGEVEESGRIVRDNVFGSIEQDAMRRDFTVNALYYQQTDSTIIDFVGALEDLDNRVLRMIGDPATRCAEDAVRCLRAARFSAKLGFSIEAQTEKAVREQAHHLKQIPTARLFEEVLKLFHSGHALASLAKLREYDLLQYLFPAADRWLKAKDDYFESFVQKALRNTDERIKSGKPVTPAFLYAVMMWPDVRARATRYMQESPPVPAILLAADNAMTDQLKCTSLPKRFSVPMREIWAMQPRLERYVGKRAMRLLEGARFRAGYDFLCLRSEVNSTLLERAEWWTEIQLTHPASSNRNTHQRRAAQKN